MEKNPLSKQEFETVFKRLLILAASSDKEITPQEVQVLLGTFSAATGTLMDESDFFDELLEMQARPMTVQILLEGLHDRLDWEQKQKLLMALMLEVAADHEENPPEMSLVHESAQLLAQTPEELKHLLEALRSWKKPYLPES